MKGKSYSNGETEIRWNIQYESLEAPPLENGERRIYLPCDICGQILTVRPDVVSTLCQECVDHSIRETENWENNNESKTNQG